MFPRDEGDGRRMIKACVQSDVTELNRTDTV